MKRSYVKEIAKTLDEINDIVLGLDICDEVAKRLEKIRSILLTY